MTRIWRLVRISAPFKWIQTLLLGFFPLGISSSEIPNFQELGKTKGAVFFLSTPRSGSNWITSSLSAITRKPISWLTWRTKVFDPSSPLREHPSYNRLGLPLVSDQPLLYRSHYGFHKLVEIPSSLNQLIFATRNPKELLLRKFHLDYPDERIPTPFFIEEFFHLYLTAFRTYENWFEENRFLIFYEDFMKKSDEILLAALRFMGEEPLFLEDYLLHNELYSKRALESYKQQHLHSLGGSSTQEGLTEIYYTLDADPVFLAGLDCYLEKMDPVIWEKYLKRFKTK